MSAHGQNRSVIKDLGWVLRRSGSHEHSVSISNSSTDHAPSEDLFYPGWINHT